MTQSSPLINKNIVRQETHKYLFTSMVSHRGIPVSFAMRDNGQIYYSVLDLSSTEKNTNVVGEDKNNDKNYWSKVTFEGTTASSLHFPTEISQIGYGVVPNFQIYKYDNNKKIIVSRDSDGKPLDGKGNVLSKKAIDDKANLFYSSTARLGAKSPFQVLSDGKYIYVFRQSISANDANNETPAIVNNTLLVDRFILSGTILKRSREIRYQRSRQKTQPASKKDTLAATDIEGKPFYEPTRELAFANNLSNGNFSILLIPGADPEGQQWQIFTGDSDTQKINSFNIKFDPSIIFDTSDSQLTVDAFIQKYDLDNTLVTSVQSGVNNNENDASIYNTLVASNNKYSEKNIPKDALVEIIYTIRTGVEKDDFSLGSMGEWPLIEYKGNSIDSKYLDRNGALQEKYTFHGPADELEPEIAAFKLQNGLSSCYYYQQEMGKDNKPMKNKASVMLAIGLEDNEPNKYIGVLNFSVSVSGQLSRITTDAVNMPDINVQALDENPYRNLKALNSIEWQKPQKMGLIDIDPNGLSTSGGVLKFAYTSSKISENQGYSDAVEATAPYLFDDSLGRVNLNWNNSKLKPRLG